MDSRLKEFRLIITDAWFHYENGLDTIIENDIYGNVLLRCMTKERPLTVSLDEDRIIEAIETTPWKDWNDQFYECYGEDGWYWSLSVRWDDKYFKTGGHNVFPKSVRNITDSLIDMGLDKDNIRFFYEMEHIYETAKKRSDVTVLSDGYFNDKFRTY